jgi:DsbC/DsbD-like thiol-disulfide interchange protein
MRAVHTSLFAGIVAVSVCTAAPTTVDHATIELIAKTQSAQPGSRAWLGIKLAHDPHWHTYWINPGDSGLPTKLNWQLPAGYQAGDVQWPAPTRFSIGGGLFNFGYDGTVLLPVAIDIPADAKPNTTVQLTVEAKWLICENECIPGKATLKFALPISAAAPVDSTAAALFAKTQAAQPRAVNWQGAARVVKDRVRIELRGTDLPDATGLDAFANAPQLLNNTPVSITRAGAGLLVDAPLSDYYDSAPKTLTLVLTQHVPQFKAWQVQVPWQAAQP